MTDRTSTIGRLAEAGFAIGPPADGPCEGCGDRWGDHVLYAPLTPLDGGTYTCPVDQCGCHGTWGVPQAAAAKQRLREAEED